MKYLDTEEKRQRRLVHIPMGRFGEAKEIARAVLFLASDESSFTTGATFLPRMAFSALVADRELTRQAGAQRTVMISCVGETCRCSKSVT